VREVYDFVYNLKVCLSKIGIETFAEKAHLAYPRYFIEDHDHEAGAAYFEKKIQYVCLAWKLLGRTRKRFSLKSSS
jgi:hypothetical protein